MIEERKERQAQQIKRIEAERAAEADRKSRIIIGLLEQQKHENDGLAQVNATINSHIRGLIYSHITTESDISDIYGILLRIRSEFSGYNSYDILNVVVSELVKRIIELKLDTKYVVECGIKCIYDFCTTHKISIDDVFTIKCVLFGHGNNTTCNVVNMSSKKVEQSPSVIHAVPPGHEALFSMAPHIADVMAINPKTGTPHIEPLRNVRRQTNTYYEERIAFYEGQLEYIEDILGNIYNIEGLTNEKIKKQLLTDKIEYTNIVISQKDKLLPTMSIEDFKKYMTEIKTHTIEQLLHFKNMAKSMKTKDESVFGTYISLKPNVLPLKILYGTECSNINKPTFLILFESQFDIVKCMFFLFMKLGNTTGRYFMGSKYDSYEDCIETFETTISRGGLNQRTNYFNNFDITKKDAISRLVVQKMLDYMYPDSTPKLDIDDILPAISDSGDRDVYMDPSWVVSYFYPIISTIYMTCCRVGEVQSKMLTRKNSEPNLAELAGGRRYKKSKCPYCGNCKNSIMYFDFTNLRNSTNNQKIVPKMISWDKLFMDTSVQKY